MKNIVWHEHKVLKKERNTSNNHPSYVLWFSGLSGSGKSTIAGLVEQRLFERSIKTYLLDGDNVRHGLCGDLGFSDIDRKENIRRVGAVADLFVDAGIVVITAFISPFRSDRRLARSLVEKEEFLEVYINTSLEECEKRDPKGLYKKARRGEIKNFTGIGSSYEAPNNAEIEIKTDGKTPEECADELISKLESWNKLTY